MAGVCRHAAPYDRRGAGEEVRSGSVIRIRYGIQFKYIYFFFLPITLTGYFMLRSVKSRNLWLLFMSCFFYIFGGAVFFPIIVYTVLLNYAGGCLLACARAAGREMLGRYVFAGTVVLNLLSLGYWKYTGFLMQIVSDLTGWQFAIPEITLPIGISFFTFQGMSYVIDLYRGEVAVQRNILKLGLYIALFPQLIAGPIVRYSDIERQLDDRKHRLDDMAAGIRIFTVGLAKKAVIANSAALTADAVFEMQPWQNSPGIAWLGLIFYTIQLYFDFSGYSDMAVGLGRMFGFRFPGNFDYPFISRSGSELWGRWHISLSSWFRDYVYIPLGGSRRGNVYLNLLCVFLLTGFWHGAAWNYVLWGLYWGIIVAAERFVSGRTGGKVRIPGIVAWAYAMLLWLVSMVIFHTGSPQGCSLYLRSMFGLLERRDAGFSLAYYISAYEIFILALGFAAMMPWGSRCRLFVKERVSEIWFALLENAVTLLLLGVSVLYVVTGTYNPFIYFQF